MRRIRYSKNGVARVVLLLGAIVLSSNRVYASDNAFTVQAILPENQRSETTGYYDLKVKPGQNQSLPFKLINAGEEEITLNIVINPAYTGDNGVFIYSKDARDKDKSLKIPISDIATTDTKVTVPPRSEVMTQIILKIPEEPFQGILLGAIRVSIADDDVDESINANEGFELSNKSTYTVGLQLQEDEMQPEGTLKWKGAYATQVTGRNTLKIKLQNPIPSIINNVSYDVSIMKKGSEEVLYERKVTNFRVAPNTNYNVPVSWNNKPFEGGTYIASLSAKSEETNQEWEFNEEFVVTSKEAKELNEKAVDLEQDYTMWIIWGFISVGILLLILIILVITLFKKKTNAQRRRKKSNSIKKSMRR